MNEWLGYLHSERINLLKIHTRAIKRKMYLQAEEAWQGVERVDAAIARAGRHT